MPVKGVPSAFVGAPQDSLATPVVTVPPTEPLVAGLFVDAVDPPPLPHPAMKTITRKERNKTDNDFIVLMLSPFYLFSDLVILTQKSRVRISSDISATRLSR
jgi:hypothetical protein